MRQNTVRCGRNIFGHVCVFLSLISWIYRGISFHAHLTLSEFSSKEFAHVDHMVAFLFYSLQVVLFFGF